MGGELACRQQPAGELPDEPFDVLVVGAGPAGSTAAILLASQGHRVLLLDRKRFPREKVCGDGLTHHAIACLQRLGLGEAVRSAAHEIDIYSSFSPSQVEVELPVRFSTLKRIRLDALMAERAVAVGAAFCCGGVHGLTQEGDGTVTASLIGSEKRVRARVGVIATGAAVSVAKRLGMVARVAPSDVAIRCYVRSSFRLDRMVSFQSASLIPGYLWVFPMGGNEYNVGCCAPRRTRQGARGNAKKALEQVVAELPLARELFRHAEAVTPARGGMVRCGLKGMRRLVSGSIVAIGETIGSTLPSTGEGIAMAMRTGELAAAAIHEALASGSLEALRDYPAAVGKELRPRHMAYQFMQALTSVGWIHDGLARLSRKGGAVHNFAVSAITGATPSRGVAVFRGVFRTLAMLRRPWLHR